MRNPFDKYKGLDGVSRKVDSFDRRIKEFQHDVPPRSNWLGTDIDGVARVPAAADNLARGYQIGSYWALPTDPDVPNSVMRLWVCRWIDADTGDATWVEFVLGELDDGDDDHYLLEITGGTYGDVDYPTQQELLLAIGGLQPLADTAFLYYNGPNSGGTAQFPQWLFVQMSNGDIVNIQNPGVSALLIPITGGTYGDADYPTHAELLQAIANLPQYPANTRFYYNGPNGEGTAARPDYIYTLTDGGVFSRTEGVFSLVIGRGLSGAGIVGDPLIATGTDELVEITGGAYANANYPTHAELLQAISDLPAEEVGTRFYYNAPSGEGDIDRPDYIYTQFENDIVSRTEGPFSLVTGQGLSGLGTVLDPLIALGSHELVEIVGGTYNDADYPTHAELLQAIGNMVVSYGPGTFYYYNGPNGEGDIDRPDYLYKQVTSGVFVKVEGPFSLVTGQGLSGAGTILDPLIATASNELVQIHGGSYQDTNYPTHTELIAALNGMPPNYYPGTRFYYNAPNGEGTLNRPDYLYVLTDSGEFSRVEGPFSLVTGYGLAGTGTEIDPLYVTLGDDGAVSSITNVIGGNRIARHGDGAGLFIDIDESITSLSRSGANLIYSKEGGGTDNVDLSDLLGGDSIISSITNVIGGNRIARHGDGAGVFIDIDESITSLSRSGNNLLYSKEGGGQDSVDLSDLLGGDSVISSISNVISGNRIARHGDGDGLFIDIDESITSLSRSGANLVYSKEGGGTDNVDLSDLLGGDSIISSITNVIGGNRIARHGDGAGVFIDIDESITSLAKSGHNLIYSREGGSTNTISLAEYINSNSVASVTNVINGSRVARFGNGNGSFLDIDETITSLAYNATTDTFTYNREGGSTNTITPRRWYDNFFFESVVGVGGGALVCSETITVPFGGLYEISFNAQFGTTGANNYGVDAWVRVNSTGQQFGLQPRLTNGVNSISAGRCFFQDLNAGDVLQVCVQNKGGGNISWVRRSLQVRYTQPS